MPVDNEPNHSYFVLYKQNNQTFNENQSIYIKKEDARGKNVRGILCKEQISGKKTFTSIAFHLFPVGLSSLTSEERVHCRSPGFHKHGLPLLPPIQVPHTFINRIEEWGIYPHEKWENIILQYRRLPGFLQAPGKVVLYLL